MYHALNLPKLGQETLKLKTFGSDWYKCTGNSTVMSFCYENGRGKTCVEIWKAKACKADTAVSGIEAQELGILIGSDQSLLASCFREIRETEWVTHCTGKCSQMADTRNRISNERDRGRWPNWNRSDAGTPWRDTLSDQLRSLWETESIGVYVVRSKKTWGQLEKRRMWAGT